MLIILERQCKVQLPGGKYWDHEPASIDKLSTIPTTNTVSERDFAQLDVLMRTKPSAFTTTFESIIMWTNNKTSDSLNSLPADEKQSILDDARWHVPDMTKKLKK
jgi:E1A/CREB-binding protein